MHSLHKLYSGLLLLMISSLQPSLAASHVLTTQQTVKQTENRTLEQPPREPPPFAFDACKMKKLGEVVEIVTPRGNKLKATCTESAKGLFARPERPPERKSDSGHPPHEK